MKRRNPPSPEILARLSFNLKRLRRARAYTQHGLAARCGFPNSYVGDIEQENVNITLANLERLAIGLDCDLYDLIAPLPTKERR